ncbi:MAG: hypothetical protein P4L40_18160 [Terracidiphilus sp.]|nr:hypothetical protein [Terracidiphilus sp.]
MLTALRRLFSFPSMLLAALFASPFFASLDIQAGGSVLRDPDIWWHLRNAQLLFSTGHFPQADTFSFTVHGQPWINPEWLAEIPFYLGFQFGAERGLFLVMLAAIWAIVAAILFLAWQRSGDIKSAFLASWVAVLLAAINLGPRTILFGWLCFLVQLALLQSFRAHPRRLWLLVPLYALWINLHGTWLIGLAFLGLFFLSGLVGFSTARLEAVRWTPHQLRTLLAVAACSIAALFLNPYGYRLVVYPFDFVFQQRLNVASIDEWAPVSLGSYYGILAVVVATALLFFTVLNRRRWQLHELLFTLLAFYAGVTHKRFLFLTGLIVAPLLAVELKGAVFSPYDPREDKPLLSALVMAGFLAFVLTHIPSSAKLRAAETQYFPVRALPALESSCQQRRVFNRNLWGGYLIWNAPSIPVFIDSRTDIFEHHGILADDLRILSLDHSTELLDRYQIGCALIHRGDPLDTQLRSTPSWHVQFEDEQTSLLIR